MVFYRIKKNTTFIGGSRTGSIIAIGADIDHSDGDSNENYFRSHARNHYRDACERKDDFAQTTVNDHPIATTPGGIDTESTIMYPSGSTPSTPSILTHPRLSCKSQSTVSCSTPSTCASTPHATPGSSPRSVWSNSSFYSMNFEAKTQTTAKNEVNVRNEVNTEQLQKNMENEIEKVKTCNKGLKEEDDFQIDRREICAGDPLNVSLQMMAPRDFDEEVMIYDECETITDYQEAFMERIIRERIVNANNEDKRRVEFTHHGGKLCGIGGLRHRGRK